jgi:hypothetical protein
MSESVAEMSFAAMMTLRDRGEDRFGGAGPGAPWGWLYGGEIVAQALRAAAATVEQGRLPNSMYSSFLRPGAEGGRLAGREGDRDLDRQLPRGGERGRLVADARAQRARARGTRVDELEQPVRASVRADG